MAIASGLESQWGFSPETTVGTRVTPATFLPFLSENIKHDIARNVSNGIFAGRRTRHVWRPGRQMVKGPVNFELAPQGFTKLGKWMMGGIATTGSGPYSHVLTPAGLDDEAMSFQFAKPDESGTVRVHDIIGAQCIDWSIGLKVGELAQASVNITGMDSTYDESLEVASYPTGWNPFSYISGSLTIGGSAYEPEEISITGSNGLAVDRHRIRATTPEWPVRSREASFREYKGTLNGDFFGLTAYNRFINGDEAALSLVLSDGASASLTIAGNVRFDGDTPNVSGDAMLKQPLPFVFTSASSDAAAFTMTLVNSDAS
jgi:hypothetical protein